MLKMGLSKLEIDAFLWKLKTNTNFLQPEGLWPRDTELCLCATSQCVRVLQVVDIDGHPLTYDRVVLHPSWLPRKRD